MLDVAVCDACAHKDYADAVNGESVFLDSNGYAVTLEHLRSGATRKAYACKETHIGKAARAALSRSYSDDGRLLDAPPLPEVTVEDQAVTQ